MNRFCLFLFLIFLGSQALGQAFTVEDIRVEGLQRVSSGSVFAALPARVGDTVDQAVVQDSIRALFRTGFFADVSVARDGNVLVITVSERPAISEIRLEGNKIIDSEQLLGSLRDNGLSEGQIFEPATLDGMTRALTVEYVAQGHYDSKIETNTRLLPRNRIAIDIVVDEGNKAAIKRLNIVGNEAFEEDELFDVFEMQTTNWLSWITKNDRYSRETFTGDLERLESFYLDRGYLEFAVESTQVSVSDDKRGVYISINIKEGTTYAVDNVDLLGELVVPEEELRRFLFVRPGQTYSQALVTATKDVIVNRLGNEGYTFAEVEEITELNQEDRTVAVSFYVNPQKRVYVRRVEFRGNTRTDDTVLRREMRQMESAPASNSQIEFGEIRLNRLGFFREVTSETTPVAGTSDQIDVLYNVEEQSSGSISASVGYAQTTGLLLGLNLQENNFLGTGDAVGFGINTSAYQERYSFNYTNPYFTPDGVSAGFSLYSTKTDYSEVSISTFNTDAIGASATFGYPLSEISRLSVGFGYENLTVETGVYAPIEISTLSEDGDSYDLFKTNLGWVRSTLNRGVLPTRGSSQRLGLEVAVPGSDLSYAKGTADVQTFVPLFGDFTMRLRAELGYGDTFKDGDRLPFFENFYAGGFGSVRGFETNTLGPRESPITGLSDVDPIGGNVLILGGLDVILPLPFIEDNRSVQATYFIDSGNVFDTACNDTQINCFEPDLGELRYSTGFSVTWISGFGPLSFSIGRTLNSSSVEEREFFQFSLGQTF